MEEIEVTEGCAGAGKSIGDIRGTTVVAALRGEDGRVQPQPASTTVLSPGDVLIAMGTTESLGRLEEAFAPPRRAVAESSG
jgi:K+/H+ antiporter YhaU regulatory subunit KhtT